MHEMTGTLRNRGREVKGLGLLFALVFCWTPGQAKPENQGREQALRQRVEAYYSLEQVGRYKEAEDYILPDSRETYESTQKGPFLGYKIQSVTFDSQGRSARVTVLIRSFVGKVGSKPLDMPYTTQWRLEKGKWFLWLAKKVSASPLQYLREHSGKGAPPAPALEWKGHNYNLATVILGEKKVARFPFKNVSGHTVTISKVITGTPLLKVEDYKKEYKPGESGELAVEFHADEVMGDWGDTLVIETEPGNQHSFLTVRAYIPPPPRDVTPEPPNTKSPLPPAAPPSRGAAGPAAATSESQ
jgi:Protein of unknown function (DUF1573)